MREILKKLTSLYEDLLRKPRIAFWYGKATAYGSLQLSDASAAMTYYLWLALFPYAIFLFAFLAEWGSHFDFSQAIASIKQLVPPSVLEFLQPLLREAVTGYRVSLFSVGAFFIVYASTKGFDTFLFTMEKIYQVESRTYVLKKLFGIAFVFLTSIVLLVFLFLLSFGNVILSAIVRWLPISGLLISWIQWMRFIFPFLLLYLLISLMYFVLARGQGEYRYALLASLVPSILWFALSLGLSWYIDHFTKYNLIYGSMTGLVLMMFWLYLLIQAVFFGAFFHRELIEAKRKSIVPVSPSSKK